MVPAKGLTLHSEGFAATTSRCESKSRFGFSPLPLSLVIKLPLPEADSMISDLKPSLAKYWAINSPALVSLPGGFVVSMRISSLRNSVISFSISFKMFMADVFCALPVLIYTFFLLKVSLAKDEIEKDFLVIRQ